MSSQGNRRSIIKFHGRCMFCFKTIKWIVAKNICTWSERHVVLLYLINFFLS